MSGWGCGEPPEAGINLSKHEIKVKAFFQGIHDGGYVQDQTNLLSVGQPLPSQLKIR